MHSRQPRSSLDTSAGQMGLGLGLVGESQVSAAPMANMLLKASVAMIVVFAAAILLFMRRRYGRRYSLWALLTCQRARTKDGHQVLEAEEPRRTKQRKQPPSIYISKQGVYEAAGGVRRVSTFATEKTADDFKSEPSARTATESRKQGFIWRFSDADTKSRKANSAISAGPFPAFEGTHNAIFESMTQQMNEIESSRSKTFARFTISTESASVLPTFWRPRHDSECTKWSDPSYFTGAETTHAGWYFDFGSSNQSGATFLKESTSTTPTVSEKHHSRYRSIHSWVANQSRRAGLPSISTESSSLVDGMSAGNFSSTPYQIPMPPIPVRIQQSSKAASVVGHVVDDPSTTTAPAALAWLPDIKQAAAAAASTTAGTGTATKGPRDLRQQRTLSLGWAFQQDTKSTASSTPSIFKPHPGNPVPIGASRWTNNSILFDSPRQGKHLRS